jgi:hypothetical protein
MFLRKGIWKNYTMKIVFEFPNDSSFIVTMEAVPREGEKIKMAKLSEDIFFYREGLPRLFKG